MKALLDTNIIIHRETGKIKNQDIGILYRWLEKSGYTKCIHSETINEINRYNNKQIVNSFNIKLDSYEKIELSSPLQDVVKDIVKQKDLNINDSIDTILLNEVYVGRVDILITEDKKIHQKARLLNIQDKIFTIDSFLEKIISENPSLLDYKVLNIQKIKFGEINLQDPFFNTLKEDYVGFDKWFIRKYDDEAYITKNSDNGKLLSFLYLKVENKNENYSDIFPIFVPKKRLKVGTFKVISNGFRLGERFLKIIFDNALKNKVDEIYVTIFNKRQEQQRLIDLLEQWGFKYFGTKGKNKELVYVREFSHTFDLNNLKKCYPYISINNQVYLVSIYPEYHTELFPDSILDTEISKNFTENISHRNCIEKVYISRAYEPYPKKGDILIFYRTGGYHKSVISTIGIVEELYFNFVNEDDFVSYCRKISVYPDKQLRAMWNYSNKKPFAVKFLYTYSFPNRINMKNLIDLGILKGIEDAPRGFKPISKKQFEQILGATKSEKSFIVD